MNPGESKRKCVYNDKFKTKKGTIMGEYEENGGPCDGQYYIIVEDDETMKIKHVKKEDVLEIIV
tara:strand:+ start:2760 stop:2951 length:192 start_codon:yes stop_codon:yes gene_type:complete